MAAELIEELPGRCSHVLPLNISWDNQIHFANWTIR